MAGGSVRFLTGVVAMSDSHRSDVGFGTTRPSPVARVMAQ